MREDTKALNIDALVLDPALQPRKGLDKPTVEKYARLYQEGKELPPIKVAVVGGRYLVVDGRHRIAALRNFTGVIEAVVVPEASKHEAVWLAMMANLTHGLPLKKTEQSRAVRRALGAYFATRRHLKSGAKGGVKPLREITEDLGSLFSHTTIRKWIWKYHRRVAERYWGHEITERFEPTEGRHRPPAISAWSTCMDSITNVLAAFPGIDGPNTPEQRGEVITKLKEALAVMEAGGPWVAPEVVTDF